MKGCVCPTKERSSYGALELHFLWCRHDAVLATATRLPHKGACKCARWFRDYVVNDKIKMFTSDGSTPTFHQQTELEKVLESFGMRQNVTTAGCRCWKKQ